MESLTQERLKQLLEYDPDTGLFKWRVNRGRSAAGAIAGTRDRYIQISVDNRLYAAHRLVWLYIFGEFPDTAIDHINNIKHDNRLSNLRKCTDSQNQMNRSISKANTSGYKGVCYHKKNNKWVAQIKTNYKIKNLGCFDNKEDAAEAYRKESELLHGEFAFKGELG